MERFTDENGCEVTIRFTEEKQTEGNHVWVVCRYKNKWLLTKHKKRGLEFPGGKVEKDELLQEAVARELYEETGAKMSSCVYIGHYEVRCPQVSIKKHVFFATIKNIIPKPHYFETDGPVLLAQLPTNIKSDSRFSFIMKDRVLPLVIKEITNRQLM